MDAQEGPGIVAREVWDRSEHETGDSVYGDVYCGEEGSHAQAWVATP